MKTLLVLIASVLLGSLGGFAFRQANSTEATVSTPTPPALVVEASESMQFRADDPQLGMPFILKPQGSGSIMNPTFSDGQIVMRFLALARSPGLQPGTVVEVYGFSPQGQEEVYWSAPWQNEERFELPAIETEVLASYGELFFRAREGNSPRPLGSMTINPSYKP